MLSYLPYATEKKAQTVRLIRCLVECESPSDDAPSLNRCLELLADESRDLAAATLIQATGSRKHLRLKFKLPGENSQGRILALGHADTVWPIGTLRSMPFRQHAGRLWGPGVLDMKSGLAFFLSAMRLLRENDIPIPHQVALLVVSDEETGSHSSRALTESEAQKSDCVLVLEPGTGLSGKLKTARKGVGNYTLSITGHASHAGVDFENGASAILEAAHQIQKIASFTNLGQGTTVNPGVISGGTRSNVIAASAVVEIDLRVTRLTHALALDKKFRALKPVDKRCTLTFDGGLNRPPMERTKAIAALFARAKAIGETIGVSIEESSTGGGSDGNFTAALGIPTLDGLGGVGEGAHAANESILLDRIPDRVALLAHLISQPL